jgi:stage 0 sporulation protein B (sporulation initiation phosphotransferase)
MEKDWDIVHILSCARHDWLNQIQLIKGNMALDRLDRVKEIVEEIIAEAGHASRLTNTKLNAFAEYVMTYNWRNTPIQLEIEVLGDVKDLSFYDSALVTWTKELIQMLEMNIDGMSTHHVSVSLLIESDSIRFFFDFSGILTTSQTIETWLEEQKTQPLKLVEKQVLKEEFHVVLQLI